ncbi:MULTISPECIES: polysaccharide lyase [unclassified Halomonas]|nr:MULTISPECIES: hypothetical protein [unclassified Halomonas]MCP1359562.1 hypothetical protein [Halomonas sp. BBD45]
MLRTSLMGVVVSSLLASAPSSALADDDDDSKLSQPSVAPCSTRYPMAAAPVPEINVNGVERAIEQGFMAKKNWGLDNVSLLSPNETGLGEQGFRVLYPEGSSAPSDNVEGGAGFYAHTPGLQGAERACLSYKVRFEPGFDFVKGGKLPGLYGGSGPTGGEEVTGTNGFSMRFMWREDGQGELYEYVVNKDSEYGESVGRGKWVFPTGQWVNVEQEIVLNDPQSSNGIARVWIDGQPMLEQQGIVYRTTDDVTIDGVMFSSFFGGHGKEWRSPRDQVADFGDFRVYVPR